MPVRRVGLARLFGQRREMDLAVIGVNHRVLPIERREALAVPESRLAGFVSHMLAASGASEVVPMFTCNRVEVYGAGRAGELGAPLMRAFAQYHSLESRDVLRFYRHEGEAALEHLFKVGASLDSMVVGEPQILSQVKSSYFAAKDLGATGKYLNFIFQKCFKAAKEIRTDTAIARNKVSVPSVAAQLAAEVLGGLRDRTALIVGAGKIGGAFAAHLVSGRVARIYVASRSAAHARELSEKANGKVVPLEGIDACFDEVDLVVGCTSAREPFLHRERCRAALERRAGRPLLIIDRGVPRNVAPEVGMLEGIHLYNIDQLEDVVEKNRGWRMEEARRANALARVLAHRTYQKALSLSKVRSEVGN